MKSEKSSPVRNACVETEEEEEEEEAVGIAGVLQGARSVRQLHRATGFARERRAVYSIPGVSVPAGTVTVVVVEEKVRVVLAPVEERPAEETVEGKSPCRVRVRVGEERRKEVGGVVVCETEL